MRNKSTLPTGNLFFGFFFLSPIARDFHADYEYVIHNLAPLVVSLEFTDV